MEARVINRRSPRAKMLVGHQKSGRQLVQIAARIDRDTMALLSVEAMWRNVTVATIIREAVAAHLKQLQLTP
jgi:hypothetical protein